MGLILDDQYKVIVHWGGIESKRLGLINLVLYSVSIDMETERSRMIH